MPKRILEGVVVSDKGDKTVVVKVERTFLHPVLKKTVRRSKKYHAHDEANAYKAGDNARIIECAPKSKTSIRSVSGRSLAGRGVVMVHRLFGGEAKRTPERSA